MSLGRVALVLAAALALASGCRPAFPSPGAAAAVTTLAVLKGRVEVYAIGANDFTPAQAGRPLVAGDRIRTGADSAAVITFFDGSTMYLDPQTDVTIYHQRLGGEDPRAVAITVRQSAGATWTRAEPGPHSPFHLQLALPEATVSVRDRATLETDTREGGPTVVRSVRGEATVTGGWGAQRVPSGKELTLLRGGTPGPPADTPLPFHRFALRFEGPAPAWLRVVDGVRRSAGATDPGLPVDQMPGALIGGAVETFQEVVLTRVQPGKYSVVLEPRGDGPFALGVTVESEGQRLYHEVRRGVIRRGQPLVATLEVQGQSSRLASATLGVFSPLRGTSPGVIVRTQFGVEVLARRNAVGPAVSPTPAPDRAPISTTRQFPTITGTATAPGTPTTSPTSTSTHVPSPTSPPRPTATPEPAPAEPPPPPPPSTPTPARPAPPPATATPASPQRGVAP